MDPDLGEKAANRLATWSKSQRGAITGLQAVFCRYVPRKLARTARVVLGSRAGTRESSAATSPPTRPANEARSADKVRSPPGWS